MTRLVLNEKGHHASYICASLGHLVTDEAGKFKCFIFNPGADRTAHGEADLLPLYLSCSWVPGPLPESPGAPLGLDGASPCRLP